MQKPIYADAHAVLRKAAFFWDLVLIKSKYIPEKNQTGGGGEGWGYEISRNIPDLGVWMAICSF